MLSGGCPSLITNGLLLTAVFIRDRECALQCAAFLSCVACEARQCGCGADRSLCAVTIVGARFHCLNLPVARQVFVLAIQ